MRWIPILLLLSVLGTKAQTDCNLKLEKDSIKVFMCKVVNSKFRSVKTTFEINSRLSQLADIVMDIDSYKSWQYKTVSAKILKKVSDHEIIYHTVVEAPSLTSNRDFVIRLTIQQDPITREMIIEAVSIPDFIPKAKEVVRVPYSRAQWTVKPISANKLAIEYYVEIDLGGLVPPWAVNLVAHQAPYETFKNLRKKIGDYKGRKVSFVKD